MCGSVCRARTIVGNGFVMASRLGMEDTGKLLQLEGERLIELPQAVIRA